ncbi:MAG: hypothetical protein ACRBK7_19640 [Acidimicrobiales bacterium]
MSISEQEQKRSKPRRVATALAATVAGSGLMIALSACGGQDSDIELPMAVEIGGNDYNFVELPDEIAAGATITLRNDSDVELHEIVAIRLPDDEDRPASELIQLPPEELGAFGFPSAVILAPVGAGNINAVGSGALDEPGRYLLFCSIPVGADQDEYLEAAATSETAPEVDGGPPHFVEGMWGEVTVVEQ